MSHTLSALHPGIESSLESTLYCHVSPLDQTALESSSSSSSSAAAGAAAAIAAETSERRSAKIANCHDDPFSSSSSSSSSIDGAEPREDAQHVASDVDGLVRLLAPSTLTRDGGLGHFCFSIFVKEFFLHMLHPYSTPFVYAAILIVNGQSAADRWIQNHLWSPSKFLSQAGNSFRRKISMLPPLIFFNSIFAAPLLLFVLAFGFSLTNITEDYRSGVLPFAHAPSPSHSPSEATYAIVFRCTWSLVVGLKYGFFSENIRHEMRTTVVSPALINSQQIIWNWSPDLQQLVLDLHVALAVLPVRLRRIHFRLRNDHSLAVYCRQCASCGDEPLCLLHWAHISSILHALPADNFHRKFWTSTPGNVRHQVLHEGRMNRSTQEGAAADDAHVTSYKQAASAAWAAVCSDMKTQVSLSSLQSSSSSSSSTRRGAEVAGFTKVPVFVLLMYCISRAYTRSSRFVGTSNGVNMSDGKLRWLVLISSLIMYFIPGFIRVAQPAICYAMLQQRPCSICVQARLGACPDSAWDAYVGRSATDVLAHVCWLFSSIFFFFINIRFVIVAILEMMRRWALMQEWADVLRHGRDKSLRFGVLLQSAETCLQWFRCRELLLEFRRSMKNRLMGSALIMFMLPVAALTSLIISITQSSAQPAQVVLSLYVGFVFLTLTMAMVAYGVKNNAFRNEEHARMSRLISHLELSTCSRARKQCSDDAALDHSSSRRGRAHATRTRGDSQRWGVTMANISDVLHGLRTVRSALKQLHRSYPETIFFVVPATAALFSTIALGCISLASVVQNQV